MVLTVEKSIHPLTYKWPIGRQPASSTGGSENAANGSVVYAGADGRQRWIKAADLRPASRPALTLPFVRIKPKPKSYVVSPQHGGVRPDIALSFHSQPSAGAHDGASHRDAPSPSASLRHQIPGDGGHDNLGLISSVLGPSVRSGVSRTAGVELRKQSLPAGRWREAHRDRDCGPAPQQCSPASLHLPTQ